MPIKANLVRKTVIDNSNYDYCHLRSVWFEEWKNGKIENILLFPRVWFKGGKVER